MTDIDDKILDAVNLLSKDVATAIGKLNNFSYDDITESLNNNPSDPKNSAGGYFFENVFSLASAFRLVSYMDEHKGFVSFDTHDAMIDNRSIQDLVRRGSDNGLDLCARLDDTHYVMCSAKKHKKTTMNADKSGEERLIARHQKLKHRIPNASKVIVLNNEEQIRKKKHQYSNDTKFVFMDRDGSGLWEGIKKIFADYVYNIKSIDEDYMRKESRISLPFNVIQMAIITQMLDAFENSADNPHPVFAVLASPRIGKTSIFTEIFRRLDDFQNLISMPYVLSANSSMVKECYKWRDFTDLNIIDVKEKDVDWESKYEQAQISGDKTITTLSIHPTNFDEKYAIISEKMVGNCIVLKDEADRGLHTTNSEEKSLSLYAPTERGQRVVEIITSGTGMEKAIRQKERLDKVICYTYLELLLAKRKNHEIFDPKYLSSLDDIKDKNFKDFVRTVQNSPDYWASTLSNVPELSYYTWDFPAAMVDMYLAHNNVDYMPTWGKILENPNKNSPFLKQFFLGVFGKSKNAAANSIHIKSIDSDADISFVNQFFIGSNEKKKLYDVYELVIDVLGDTHEVVMLCGEVKDCDGGQLSSRETNETAEDSVKQAIQIAKNANKEGVIVLTMGMAARSFSITDLTTHLVFDCGSINDIEQKGLRSCTPGMLESGKEKTHGRIFAYPFSTNYVSPFQFLHNYAKTLAYKTGKSIRECNKTLLLTVNIFSVNEDGITIQLTADDFFEKLYGDGTAVERMLVSHRFEEHMDILLNTPSLLKIINDIDLKNQGWSKQKNAPKIKNGKKWNKSAPDRNVDKGKRVADENVALISKLAAFLARFYGSLSDLYKMSGLNVDDDDTSTLNDVMRVIKNDELLCNEFIDQVGIPIESVYEFIDNDCLNIAMVDYNLNQIQNGFILDTASIWN